MGRLDPADLVPALDVETADGVSAPALLDAIGVWLERVQTATGRRPVIYTTVDFWTTALGNSTRFGEYPLWIADYTRAAHPTVPGGWATWTLWQYADTGTVPGIAGPVDLDRANGAIENLTMRTVVA